MVTRKINKKRRTQERKYKGSIFKISRPIQYGLTGIGVVILSGQGSDDVSSRHGW